MRPFGERSAAPEPGTTADVFVSASGGGGLFALRDPVIKVGLHAELDYLGLFLSFAFPFRTGKRLPSVEG